MGIFDAHANVFTVYRARLQFRDRVMGGTPKDPKIIEGWLRSKAGIEQAEEIRQAMLKTLIELGAEVSEAMGYAELVAASEKLAGGRQTVGFRRDEGRPYIESRQVKAMLKESTNILFAGDRWGPTAKGPRAVMAERVFVRPDKLILADDIDGIDLFIGHVDGPRGRQSSLTYHEFVERAGIEFEVQVAEFNTGAKRRADGTEAKTVDALTPEQWAMIWVHAQENGLGAMRSQGFGRFDIEAWEPVGAPSRDGREVLAVV